MEEKQIPIYLRKMVSNYLSCRSVIYLDSKGREVEREVCAGVSQGSVLGPLLWNIAFNSVLRLRSEEDCHTVCYADDTLLIAASDTLFGALINVNIQIARTIRHISKLGLKVAETKTEAIFFSKNRPIVLPSVKIGSVEIQLSEAIKYLGVMIDGSWSFKDHFKYIVCKVQKASRALNRLMPNLRGPEERKRQLYAGILTSVFMYAVFMSDMGRKIFHFPG